MIDALEVVVLEATAALFVAAPLPPGRILDRSEHGNVLAIFALLLACLVSAQATPAYAQPAEKPDIDLYALMNSKSRPRVDGIPVPATEPSGGVCRQIGSFAALKITSISCSATDQAGRTYELQFVSDGTPITLRRIL